MAFVFSTNTIRMQNFALAIVEALVVFAFSTSTIRMQNFMSA